MCGRARCTVRVDTVGAACGFRAPLRTVNADRYYPSYNVAPGAHMPVVRHDPTGDATEPVVHCMRWGLVPSFTKKSEKPDFYRMFNARSESVHQKSSFRRLLTKNRCLTTVEGFYEWKKDGKKKQPYYVHLGNGHPLVFAALYDSWETPQGETMFTFTILTTRASKRLEWLHDRMPVVLKSQEAIDSWMKDELSEDAIHNLTQPYEAPDLVWYPVTPAMGRPAFNGPECVEEIKPKIASESNIAQMFEKQLAQDNIRHSDIVLSQEIKDEPCVDEEDRKALLAGMEPDQDVTDALCHSEVAVDIGGKDDILNDDQPEVLRPGWERKEEAPGSSPQSCSSQGNGDTHFQSNRKKDHKVDEVRDVSRTGPANLKASSFSTPVKTQARKASTDVKDQDSKRRRTNNTIKETSKDVMHAGVKQKQSNLLGFFSKQ